MEADIPHHDDVTVPVDAETLALSQYEWLQFEPDSTTTIRCRRILRMSVATPRCIDWGVLADVGQAERARASLGEDTQAHQAAVREQEDEELPPDIDFSLCGKHLEMSIERFAVHLGRATLHGVLHYTKPPSTTDRSAGHCGEAPLSPTSHTPEAWSTCFRICRRSSLALEALLHHVAAWCDEMAQANRCRAAWETRVERRLDRLEDLVQWTVASEHARRDGSQLPPLPEPHVYPDDGSSAGPSGVLCLEFFAPALHLLQFTGKACIPKFVENDVGQQKPLEVQCKLRSKSTTYVRSPVHEERDSHHEPVETLKLQVKLH
ncbi:hypothetical protein R6Q59_001491 [Mikania micrantha]